MSKIKIRPQWAVIPLPDTAVPDSGRDGESRQKSRQKSRQRNSERLLVLMRRDPSSTTLELMRALGLSRAGVQKIVSRLKKAGRLRRIGPDKGGRWEVVEKA